jgi:Xaa-Pro aminopeptidase
MATIRIEQIRSRMDGLGGVLLRLPENVLLATGYWPQLTGLGFAVVPAYGDPVLIVPEYEEPEAAAVWPGEIRTFPVVRLDGPAAGDVIAGHLQDLGRTRGLAGAVVGYEGSYETVAPPAFLGETFAVAEPTRELWKSAAGAESLADVTPLLEEIKAIKTDHDIERLRLVNEIAGMGMDAFKEAARPGRTEIEIAAAVESAIALGTGYGRARVTRGFATVSSGPDAAVGWQYFRSRARAVENGDWVLLELGTVVDGYWSDHTRTVVAGTASDAQRDVFAAARAACTAALAACVPGIVGDDVDRASREACAAAGYTQFPHHTGHGVGFRYHEGRPGLVPGGSDVVAEAMVVAIEPGIYEEGLGGVRWEENAVVTASGAQTFVETGYGLD